MRPITKRRLPVPSPRVRATRKTEQQRNPRRTGAQKRKERGRRGDHARARYGVVRQTLP